MADPIGGRSKAQVAELIERLGRELDEARAERDALSDELASVKRAKACFGPLLQSWLDDKQRHKSASREYLGVADFDAFHVEVKDFLVDLKAIKMSHKELLMYTLLWARKGKTWKQLAQDAGRKKSTLQRDVLLCVAALRNWADKFMLTLPSVDAWLQQSQRMLSKVLPEELQGYLFIFVDGTVIKVFDPFDHTTHKFMWNSKHAETAYTFFIAVTPDGRIIYLSELTGASRGDHYTWNNSDIVKLLTEKYPLDDDGKLLVMEGLGTLRRFLLAVGGDKGYPGIRLPPGWHLFLTMTGRFIVIDDKGNPQPLNDVTAQFETKEVEGNSHFTPNIAQHRCVVERVFGAMKKWLVVHNTRFTTRTKVTDLTNVIRMIGGICNWMLTQNEKGW